MKALQKLFTKRSYYFIYYNFIQRTWLPENKGGKFGSECNENYQILTDIHPLQWQHEANEEYSKYRIDEHGYKKYEKYTVISWQKVSKKMYNKWNNTIG